MLRKSSSKSLVHPQLAGLTRLSSSIIAETKEGVYSFEQCSILRYHEPLRQELARAERAIRAVDRVDAPNLATKAQNLHFWLSEFFFPVLCLFEQIELTVLIPFYLKLGATIPPLIDQSDLGNMLSLCKNLITCSKELHGQAFSNQNIVSLSEKVKELRRQFYVLRDYQLQHYAAEEILWPQIIKKYGQPQWKEVSKLMISTLVKRKDHIGENLLAMIISSIEYDQYDHKHIPWCSSMMRRAIVKDLTFSQRAISRLLWVPRYRRHKAMIDMVIEEIEVPVNFNTSSSVKMLMSSSVSSPQLLNRQSTTSSRSWLLWSERENIPASDP